MFGYISREKGYTLEGIYADWLDTPGMPKVSACIFNHVILIKHVGYILIENRNKMYTRMFLFLILLFF